jgi:hypothetical protein
MTEQTVLDLQKEVSEMREGFYKIRAAVKWDGREGLWNETRQPFARGFIEGVCASHLYLLYERVPSEARDNYLTNLVIAESTLRNVIAEACEILQNPDTEDVESVRSLLRNTLQMIPSPKPFS